MSDNVAPLPALGIPLLFDYLYWFRDRVLRIAGGLSDAAFLETPSSHGRDLRATLAHELDVETSWRARLRGRPESEWGPEAEIEPQRFTSVAELEAMWREDEAVMREWLRALAPSDLDRPVTTNRLEGYPLSIYLLHVIEHGVTELASAAGILHGMGHAAGDLGVLNALDDLAPMPRPGAA